jgi:hypothetical protein
MRGQWCVRMAQTGDNQVGVGGIDVHKVDVAAVADKLADLLAAVRVPENDSLVARCTAEVSDTMGRGQGSDHLFS